MLAELGYCLLIDGGWGRGGVDSTTAYVVVCTTSLEGIDRKRFCLLRDICHKEVPRCNLDEGDYILRTLFVIVDESSCVSVLPLLLFTMNVSVGWQIPTAPVKLANIECACRELLPFGLRRAEWEICFLELQAEIRSDSAGCTSYDFLLGEWHRAEQATFSISATLRRCSKHETARTQCLYKLYN